jgi:hypothetical protein
MISCDGRYTKNETRNVDSIHCNIHKFCSVISFATVCSSYLCFSLREGYFSTLKTEASDSSKSLVSLYRLYRNIVQVTIIYISQLFWCFTRLIHLFQVSYQSGTQCWFYRRRRFSYDCYPHFLFSLTPGKCSAKVETPANGRDYNNSIIFQTYRTHNGW